MSFPVPAPSSEIGVEVLVELVDVVDVTIMDLLVDIRVAEVARPRDCRSLLAQEPLR